MPDHRSFVSRWADQRRRAHQDWGSDPAAFRPEAVAETLRRVGRWVGEGRYLDTVATGLQHVPDRQVLLVANHSGGTSIPDMWGLLTAWYRHFGPSRPLFVMGHELIFATEPTARYFAKRGVLRASMPNAQRVLERGHDLLVTPGGDQDVWRPWSRRWTIDFAGRTGYARLSLQQGVPIVPVAGAGAHHTLLVLTRGRRLARWLRLGRLARAEIWPVHLSLPWGLAIGPWPHLPVPRRLRFRFGPVLEPGVGEGGDQEVRALDARVRHALQRELDALREAWPRERQSVWQTVHDVVRPQG